VGLNFPTPAVLLVLPGLTAALRTSKYKLWGVMLVVLLGIHLVWAVRYNVPDQYTFFIPAWVLLAVVLGLGADRFLRCRSRRWAGALLAAAALPAAVYVPLPQIARALKVNLGVGRSVPYRDDYAYFLHPWKTGYQGAERFAVEVGRMLPPGAVFLAESTTVRPIHYLQLTGRWRTDVRVFPPVRWLEDGSTDLNEQTIAGPLADGLVYVVSLQPGYCPPWLLERYSMVQEGIIYRVSGRKANGPP
jgi:hypothetical protein